MTRARAKSTSTSGSSRELGDPSRRVPSENEFAVGLEKGRRGAGSGRRARARWQERPCLLSFSDAGDAPTALHTTDRAFSIRTPIPGDLGKPWTSTSGLRFRQHILDAETNDHKSAVVTVLLGTAPSVSGSMAGVMAVILTDDEAARRALAPALESISTF